MTKQLLYFYLFFIFDLSKNESFGHITSVKY